eukprot:NODE_854_length_3699_cov_0.222500.p3 type:complete len:138 gc:universal NODE_854_length_3699_cov_0.222500:3099-3512(+)
MEYSSVAVLLYIAFDPISEYWVTLAALCCLDRVLNDLDLRMDSSDSSFIETSCIETVAKGGLDSLKVLLVSSMLPDITGVLSNVLERLEIWLPSTYFTQLESDASFILTSNGLFAMLQTVISWMSLMNMFVMRFFDR